MALTTIAGRGTPPVPRDNELREALHFLPITRLERRVSAYSTSCPLEEIDAHLDDGRTLPLLFKNLSPAAWLEGARHSRPAFLYDSRREIATYRSILAAKQLGTATCFSAVVDAAAERYWLFLERVPGVELYQVGEFHRWQQAVRWLATFHGSFAEVDLAAVAGSAHLLVYTREYYWRWPNRALAFAHRAAERDSLSWLLARYKPVVDLLLALPPTLVHGELYASNVLVDGERVCAVDWETAGVGSGLVDLAALTAGGWSNEQRRALILAYHAALPAERRQSLDSFLVALDCCRLHIALQWLGWAADWSPPREHAQDWLGEMLYLADQLGL